MTLGGETNANINVAPDAGKLAIDARKALEQVQAVGSNLDNHDQILYGLALSILSIASSLTNLGDLEKIAKALGYVKE